jgi:hypothetical protein
MLRYVLALVVVAALALPTTEVSAQDPEAISTELVGEGETETPTPGGDTFTETLVFVFEDGEIEGLSKTDFGETELDEVTFEDGTLTFEVTRTFGGQSFTQVFTATIAGDEMTGTVEGTPGAEGPQQFIAVRATG